ncbi:ESX secretion-associated protein EspG [Gordonia sp. ABSL1-1]|uniref:ESX secretion-associated protein EspG n=1 Tax=Gordonia sp. ABSL1-1 TaxID=3053923 RepID=UPI002573DDD1|nr:ESX secretion-associated protein EspG [Gordonia sp. ABSL1-1]MDL9937755.1 ESX secretion-associated protein EspG [Gordonia sp. ABSL1-1]
MSTVSLDLEHELTVDEVLTLVDRLGIDTTPEALALWPTQPTIVELELARDACAQALADRDLIVDGEIDQDLAHVLGLMRRPERELSIRLITAEGLLRATILRVGRAHVVATRRGETVRLRAFDTDLEDRVIAEVGRLLPKPVETQCDSVSAPIAEIDERLAGLRAATPLADELHGLGADHRSAIAMSSVLADYEAAAEIRVSALDSESDRTQMIDGVVAVFYSARGSVITVPTISADDQLWCSVKGGSGHRLAQAIGQLMSLLPERW